jgi:flavin reductase (DIM6/NTAB) family NADH-FMN oxidoreductase RutF
MNINEAKKALYNLTYGVYLVTSYLDGTPGGATVVWVTQSSKEPLAVMVGLMEDSRTGEMIEKSKVFAINILNTEQDLLIKRFSTKLPSADKFNGIDYIMKRTGSPIIKDAVAYIDCRLTQTIKPGSHKIYLGEVVDANMLSKKSPAIYRSGKILKAAA